MLKLMNLLITTGTLTLLSSVPAIAQDTETVVSGSRPDDVAVAYVKYRDLNLSNKIGAERLQRRVRRAARSVCIDDGNIPLMRRMEGNKCFVRALAGAEPQIARAIERFRTNEFAARPSIVVKGAN
jgi:UrcA family protein